ncbi:glycoside hydrolase family 114 protein, partial [Piromyces sp. E2]
KKSDRDVISFDLENAEKVIPTLHKKGQKAVCYFSGGEIDSKTNDYKDFVKADLIIYNKRHWENYFIDIRKLNKLKPLIKNRLKRALKYGCDAVEVDNINTPRRYEKSITEKDSIKYAKMVAETAHEVGLSIGLKNSPEHTHVLEPYFDFAIVENCAKYDECKYFQVFTRNNKAVFTVHYSNRGYSLTSNLSTLIKTQKGYGFTCVISSQDLQNHSINYNCDTGKKIGNYLL